MSGATDRLVSLANEVRRACLDAALDAYEDGGIQGLCEQGRWELVVQRLRSLDVDGIVRGWEEVDDAERSTGAGESS